MREGGLNRLGRSLLPVGMSLALVGCITPSSADPPAVRWERVPLEVQVDSLAAAQDGVLIGAHTGDGEQARPHLYAFAAGRVTESRLNPSTPYGEQAQISEVADGPRGVALLGVARGGAHANPRWTIWSGPATSVDEHEQNFWTFGGHESGTMVALVATGEGAAVFGSWGGQHGMDVTIWTETGDRWERHDSTGTELASTSRRQVAAHDAGSTGDGVTVIAGEQLELDHELRRRPVVWVWPARDQPVRRLELPGASGRADTVTCAGGACWAAGVVDGRAALWQVWPGVPKALDLPQQPVDPDTPVVVVRRGERVEAVATVDGTVRLVGAPGVGPRGRPVASATAPDGSAVVVVREQAGSSAWHVPPQ